jgi:prepilin-type N-terminal cleavage/methylation domain-containing protein
MRRVRQESGFTLIELLVAATVMVIGVMSMVVVFDSSRKLTTIGQKQETAAHVGEKELESILAMPYASIALAATPAHATDPNSPDYYVSTDTTPLFQWDRSDTKKKASFCVQGTGDAACQTGLAHTSTWTEGGLSGTLYRYVSWIDDACSNCTATADYKRVTLALTIDGPNAPKKPIWVSTVVIDPQMSPGKPKS